MNKYDDLLAASQKLSKQYEELIKSIVVLKLENCRIANEFQSPDADFEKKKLTDKNKLIASLTSDNKALELELKNSKEFFLICHFYGTRGHIRPRCNKLRNKFVRSNSHVMGGKGLIRDINPTNV
ncbi:unnamed protein product [Prunus armeniaca]